MWVKGLKRFFLLLVLRSLLFFSPYSYSLYAEVRLTDEEAKVIMSEIEESKRELENVKQELIQSQKDLEEHKTVLQNVKNDYEEQRISYEKQLAEALTKGQSLKIAVAVTTTSTVLTTVAIILLASFVPRK